MMRPKITRMLGWKRALFTTVIIAFSSFLTGCIGVIQADITLYSGEEWKANVDLILTQQDVSMVGGEATIEAELQRQVVQLRQQGVRYSWHKEYKEGNLIYHLSIEGKDWATLNQAVFNGQAQIQFTEEGYVHFWYMPVFAGRAFTLRLTGGEILSSNADEVSGRTAIWYNVNSTGYAEATLTEATRLSLPCLGIVVPILMLVPIGMLATRHKSKNITIINTDNPMGST